MTKPENYGQTCVLLQNMPYQCKDENKQGATLSGGVLSKGQVVWVEPAPEGFRFAPKPGSTSISGYVENIGVVSLDPRYLAPASNG